MDNSQEQDVGRPKGSGPLTGISVVMLGGLGPGPFCGMLLADLGAKIIRVDRISEVDRPVPIDFVMRRSQNSIAVDLKQHRGRDIVRALVAEADAFVDVYRPGVATRLGLGPDELLRINERLVYAQMTGWGQDGPLAQMAGHDINYIALTGALHATGTRETPIPPLNVLGDFGGGGMLLGLGLLAAILESRQSGKGQVIDVAMVDGAATLMAVFYGMLAQGTWRDDRHTNVVDGAAHFYRTYETSDHRHFAVGALEPHMYKELCDRLGVDVPHDYENHIVWNAHAAQLSQVFRTRTRAEWEEIIMTPNSCAAPVLSLRETANHPHNRHRSTFIEIDGVVQPSPSPRFSRTKSAVPRSPALPGDQTIEILRGTGLNEPAIQILIDDDIVRQSVSDHRRRIKEA